MHEAEYVYNIKFYLPFGYFPSVRFIILEVLLAIVR